MDVNNIPEAKVFGNTCPRAVAVEEWVAWAMGSRSSSIEAKLCMTMGSTPA
jgi:hypothetical protein